MASESLRLYAENMPLVSPNTRAWRKPPHIIDMAHVELLCAEVSRASVEMTLDKLNAVGHSLEKAERHVAYTVCGRALSVDKS